MRSIVVRKRANEDWLAPKPIPNNLARVEAFALELLPDRLAPLDRRYCNQTAMPAGLSGDHRDDRVVLARSPGNGPSNCAPATGTISEPCAIPSSASPLATTSGA
jgi:hypothetical protein